MGEIGIHLILIDCGCCFCKNVVSDRFYQQEEVSRTKLQTWVYSDLSLDKKTNENTSSNCLFYLHMCIDEVQPFLINKSKKRSW